MPRFSGSSPAANDGAACANGLISTTTVTLSELSQNLNGRAAEICPSSVVSTDNLVSGPKPSPRQSCTADVTFGDTSPRGLRYGFARNLPYVTMP